MHDPDDLLYRYIEALEGALRQVDVARRLRPDHGLDHAHDRLRAMITHAATEAFAAHGAVETKPAVSAHAHA